MPKNAIHLKIFLMVILFGLPVVAQSEEGKSASEQKDTELITGVTLDSPDKTHSLSVKKDEAAGGEIILKDFRSGEEREVYEYPRSISAIWSPNSALFLLNDAGGSDYSDCLVYILNDKTLIDLQDILKANKSLKGFSDDIPGKSYLEAKRWISNKRIELTLDGWIDTDIDGSGLYDFNLKLIFDLDKKSFEVISKK